jgi:23S rRNA (guanosine2251-2'-O)-methyltransferase
VPRGRRSSRSSDDEQSSVVAGRRPVLELLRLGHPVESVVVADTPSRSEVLREIKRRVARAQVPLRVVPRAELDIIARGLNHQGVAAIAGRYRYAPLERLLAQGDPAVLFVDGVTDPQNLGSLLRSAEGAGFSVVVPVHRAAAVTPAVRRVSAGASEMVHVARVTNLSRAVDEARAAGLWILGLDQEAERYLWESDLAEPPVGFVVGAEDRGISRSVRQRCDDLVRIPQVGRLGALNVAVAGAIAMFDVVRRRQQGLATDSATL